MRSLVLQLISIIIFVTVMFVCVDSKNDCQKCTWVGWAAWEGCNSGGAKRRLRLACCPDDLKEFTLEECFTRCYNESKGQMMLTNLYEYTACNASDIYNKFYNGDTYSSSSIREDWPLIAGFAAGGAVFVASHCLMAYCLWRKKKKERKTAVIPNEKDEIDRFDF